MAKPPDLDPTQTQTIGLEISDDQGRSFGAVRLQPIYVRGEYRRRIIWHRLGASRDRVFRITTDGESPVTLQAAAYLEVSEGQ